MRLEPVIGLEIHVQLKTASKMFCGCSNRGEFEPPNTTVCPVCLGHPGTLPVINGQALAFGVLIGRALGCRIADRSKFDRKNYFYPDLPKGYQISQFDLPIALGGKVNLEITGKGGETRQVTTRINRLHLEEDAAKLHHAADRSSSLVDFNRSGTPLAEIVTEPDLRSPAEAKAFLQELRLIMRYLGVSDADMEKGHLRCDANISLREIVDEPREEGWAQQLNPKTERLEHTAPYLPFKRIISKESEVTGAASRGYACGNRGMEAACRFFCECVKIWFLCNFQFCLAF